ncbi:hypothetical protein AcV5_001708 [Taiwanofungus camphoratus]|nr:hypothetical protein AcV5_001708 [Antrodia cinnamomea]
MTHVAALIEEARQDEYESALYHVYDCVLNFTALRTGNRDNYISIYPRAALRLHDDLLVPDVERAERVTRSNVGNIDVALNELSLEKIGDDHTEATASSSHASARTNQP